MTFWRVIGISITSAIVGALLTLYAVTGKLAPANMSYADLAATLLATVSVIFAIFGGILAIAAFWGFEQMKVAAISAATQASVAKACEAAVAASINAAAGAGVDEIREQIENGPLRAYMNEQISKEINSPELERKFVDRITRIALGRRDDDLLDEDGDNG